MRRLLHVASVGLLVAGVLFVLVAALSGCAKRREVVPEIVETDMGDGVRCYTWANANSMVTAAALQCVYVPPDADCWPD